MKKPLQRPIHRSKVPDQETLDRLAGEALAYLAADADLLARFFAETGLSPAELRTVAAKRDFAASLIEYLATDERAFVGFAQAAGYDPAALDALRQSLAPPVRDP